MSASNSVNRRDFLNQSMMAGAAGILGASAAGSESPATPAKKTEPAAENKTAPPANATEKDPIPCGMIGKAKISRLLLGGNLISGFMHSRDLKYVNSLFRAYATEEKILETLKLAEECGINTVFETGANFVERYNREFHGHMQFIPHIEVDSGQSESSLADHIKHQVDSGAVALYVWGIAADSLVRAGDIKQLAKTVELAKKHSLPVGVGGHSLQVPVACEKNCVPCDFYVKTLHSDDYPSATPKEQRQEYQWLDNGVKGAYDNMWCINPEETIEFMKTVTKPWIAFKVLAAGAFLPRQGFHYAFKNGADFIAVGMIDFQLKADSEVAVDMIHRSQHRERAWRA